ncbi:MAG: aspartoacylase [Cyanobacteria bacterium RM1_2_2]|nr:aspartoacylase [Cyanobacteria bacterium RM1_2_2]
MTKPAQHSDQVLISRVLIVGGTHGNEFTGAYLIKKLEHYPALAHRASFETLTLFANPQAFAAKRRYIDKDLNRCFRRPDLQNLNLTSYEDLRAREIDRQFGAKGETPVNVIVDLHTTTSNMGLTVMVDDHPFNLRLAAHLKAVNPSVNVYALPESRRAAAGLPSICPFGCTIEVGPIAQSVLNAEIFQKTEALVHTVLDYLDQSNQGKNVSLDQPFTFYRHVGTIDYPRNGAGEIQAMVHPQLQFKDYQLLCPGDPLFLTFAGETLSYKASTPIYPVFINEAAYYEKGIAMCITEQQEMLI